MISCLTDYIGLEDVTTPKSGRYINELPGLDTDWFDEIRKSETYDIDQAWGRVQDRAIRKFEQHINKAATKYFRNYSYIDNAVTSQITTDSDISKTSNYAGWLFDEFSPGGKNLTIVIPWVDIYSSDNAVSAVYIYNAVTGDLIDTVTHTFTSGIINRVTMRKEYPSWKYPKLFVCYDESVIGSKKTTDTNFGYSFNLAQKRVPSTSSIVSANLVSTGSSGQGMMMAYSISCSLDNYICQRLNIFEEPFLYLLGAEFVQESLFSKRVNEHTLLDRDEAKILRDELMNEYKEMINGVLTGLRVDYPNDYCFQCEREVNYKVLLP
jgi:hypothetical protein